MVKAIKAGPQIVTVSVRGKNTELVNDLWNVIADSTIKKSSSINANGDPMLGIYRLSDSPITREIYKPLWLCILSGALVATLLVVSFITLRSYFKWK
jgi:capsular polysaccharide biosynthesis protein